MRRIMGRDKASGFPAYKTSGQLPTLQWQATLVSFIVPIVHRQIYHSLFAQTSFLLKCLVFSNLLRTLLKCPPKMIVRMKTDHGLRPTSHHLTPGTHDIVHLSVLRGPPTQNAYSCTVSTPFIPLRACLPSLMFTTFIFTPHLPCELTWISNTVAQPSNSITHFSMPAMFTTSENWMLMHHCQTSQADANAQRTVLSSTTPNHNFVTIDALFTSRRQVPPARRTSQSSKHSKSETKPQIHWHLSSNLVSLCPSNSNLPFLVWPFRNLLVSLTCYPTAHATLWPLHVFIVPVPLL